MATLETEAYRGSSKRDLTRSEEVAPAIASYAVRGEVPPTTVLSGRDDPETIGQYYSTDVNTRRTPKYCTERSGREAHSKTRMGELAGGFRGDTDGQKYVKTGISYPPGRDAVTRRDVISTGTDRDK